MTGSARRPGRECRLRKAHRHRPKLSKADLAVIAWLDGKRTGRCSFCSEKSVSDTFVVEACAVHRKAFIDGKLGEDACISLEEHRLVTDLRKLVDKYQGKLRFEVFYKDERPPPRKTRPNRPRRGG